MRSSLPEETFTFSLNKNVSIYTAVLSAIHQAFLLISDRRISESIICTDSLGALLGLCAQYSSNPLVQQIHDQLYFLNVSGSRVLFTWIPAHCGIPGNDSADQAAKEAVHNAPTQIPFVPASDLKCFLRKEILTQWNDDWRNSTTSYVSLSLRYELGRHLHAHHVGRRSSLPVFGLVIVWSVMCIYYATICDTCGEPLSVQHLLLQ